MNYKNKPIVNVDKLTPELDEWKICVTVEKRTPLKQGPKSEYFFATLCDINKNKISLKFFNDAATSFNKVIVEGSNRYIIEGTGFVIENAHDTRYIKNPFEIVVNNEEDLKIKKVNENNKTTPDKSTPDKNSQGFQNKNPQEFAQKRAEGFANKKSEGFSIPCPNKCRDEVVILMDRGRSEFKCFSCQRNFVDVNKSPE